MNIRKIWLCVTLLFIVCLMLSYNQLSVKMFSLKNSQSSCDVELTRIKQRAIIENIEKNVILKEGNSTKKREKVIYFKTPRKLNNSFSQNSCTYKKISWTMYTFVKSAAQNFRQREIVRRTWALLSYVNGGRLETVFVVGVTSQDNQNLLDEESTRYEDILQVDVDDGYRSIGQKTLAGMQWASENLPDDYFYSSADDDFLVNTGGVQETVDEYREFVAEKLWPEFPILCIYKSRIGDSPMRESRYKSYIPFEEYVWPHFPDYCLGGMYTTSVKVASMLWEASRTQHVIRMDDVWITGILRQKVGIPRQYIITLKNPLAFHFTGFSMRNSLEAKDYVTMEWKKIYDTFSTKDICTRE